MFNSYNKEMGMIFDPPEVAKKNIPEWYKNQSTYTTKKNSHQITILLDMSELNGAFLFYENDFLSSKIYNTWRS